MLKEELKMHELVWWEKCVFIIEGISPEIWWKNELVLIRVS